MYKTRVCRCPGSGHVDLDGAFRCATAYLIERGIISPNTGRIPTTDRPCWPGRYRALPL